MRPRRIRRVALAQILLVPVVLGLAGCSSDAVDIAPPTPTGAGEQACRELATALPATVDGADRSTTRPESPFTAAWSDITMSCGGPEAQVPPDAQLFTVDGVDWFPEELPQGGTRFRTVGRVATVAVTVPATRTPAANALIDLARPVRTTVPAERGPGSSR